ncbi:hypothetical protein GMDG_01942 [Pseudogymnoascus destructans 20631-21]|uniref:Uncharacterized protein n=1 Tax=Pseudogymnoascus destructans (strain ATCC MYA-4855 / 20631-21) TaxID=658429 RepID=L8G1X9_PSED2|nr:hypothetical protein GMDG_01942 [Pseudogymnoascus destructans 20631-21]
MPSTPHTPTHSRRPSALSSSISPAPSPQRRQSVASHRSKTSISSQTPTSPGSRLLRSDSLNDAPFSPSDPASNGLGNLADELADAWASDEDEAEPDMNFARTGAELADASAGSQDEADSDTGTKDASQKPRERDSGVSISGSPAPRGLAPNPTGHRCAASDYDGSDYGSSSSLPETGLPMSLLARINGIESLARRGLEDNGDARSGVVKRVVESLRDLSGQGGVETGATRLITANTALSSHLMHQTRTLHSLTYPLISPMNAPLDEESIEELLPLLVGLGEAMPRPDVGSLVALTGLHGVTGELIEKLGGVGDSLHMSRQTTSVAARRLREAKEMVEDLRKEEERREEGERWLRRGGWGDRLGKRECARVCGEVVGGFEEVCEGWRRRLGEGVGA